MHPAPMLYFSHLVRVADLLSVSCHCRIETGAQRTLLYTSVQSADSILWASFCFDLIKQVNLKI